MTSITTIVKYRVRTTGLEHQGQNSISDPGQNLGLTCILSSGTQEIQSFNTFQVKLSATINHNFSMKIHCDLSMKNLILEKTIRGQLFEINDVVSLRFFKI